MPDENKPDIDAALAGTQIVLDRRVITPAILLLANLLRRSGNITYRDELGLSSIEWSVIARLGENGPMTQTELAETSLMDKGQLSRAALKLWHKGLIGREKRTWRSIELRLSTKGQKLFASIQRISRVRHEFLTNGISSHDLRAFYRTLDTIIVNASALLTRLKPENHPDVPGVRPTLPVGRASKSRVPMQAERQRRRDERAHSEKEDGR